MAPVLIDVVLDGLAVARLTQLVIADRITEAPRLAVVDWAKDHTRHGELVEYWSGCPWCVGMYVALGAAYARNTRVWRAARYPLALSCIAGVVGDLA